MDGAAVHVAPACACVRLCLAARYSREIGQLHVPAGPQHGRGCSRHGEDNDGTCAFLIVCTQHYNLVGGGAFSLTGVRVEHAVDVCDVN